VVTSGDVEPWIAQDPGVLVDAARVATWRGSANQLSPDHVEWSIIDEVARATRYPGPRSNPNPQLPSAFARPIAQPRYGEMSAGARFASVGGQLPNATIDNATARELILRRRSAVAFDGRSTMSKERFFTMLERLQPRGAPWDAIDWTPQVHLVLFVHRVDGLTPGVYAYLRDPGVRAEWRAAMRPEFLWERVDDLDLLVPTDVTWAANRVSCDQDIAGDGFFSLGMIARLRPSLAERGEWFYRRLFWECGLIGQVLYLEAEAAGARSTGIGCFYDDAVHETLGLSGDTWQSLYHFSMGMPVDDPRLTTEPGYAWERSG